MSWALAGWLSLVGIFAVVVGYWLFSLAGWSAVRPFLGWPRRLLLGLGVVGVVAAASGSRESTALVPLFLGTGMTIYALTRQWFFCPTAANLVKFEGSALAPEELVVSIPGELAIPLRVLGRHRTVRIGEFLVVHCSLSRSLACFEAPDIAVRADLPHGSGFSIRGGQRRWDGVDGVALDAGNDLIRRPLELYSKANWEADFPDGQLFARDAKGPLPSSSERVPLSSAARQVIDPMMWGKANTTLWRPLLGGATDSRSTLVAGDPEDTNYLLSRWAAHARGLRIAESEP